jgi:hypothetical protein
MKLKLKLFDTELLDLLPDNKTVGDMLHFVYDLEMD